MLKCKKCKGDSWYDFEVYYELGEVDESLDKRVRELGKKFGGEEIGSGGGFGMRDFEFGFESLKEGKGFMKEVRKIKEVKGGGGELVCEEGCSEG